MRTFAFKMGENIHKIIKLIIFTKRGLRVFTSMVGSVKRLRFMVEKMAGKGKGVATNENGLGVELGLKTSKFRLGKIGVVVHVNKMACLSVEKLNFTCMNLAIMSHLGKGDLDCKARSNTICWCVLNPSLVWKSILLS
jgi:hypothetical protein